MAAPQGRGRRRRLAVAAPFLAAAVLAGCTTDALPPVPPPPTVWAPAAYPTLADDSHFEYTEVREHWFVLTDDASRVEEQQRTRYTWRAADGWSWTRQVGDGAGLSIVRPRLRFFSVTDVPPDPMALEAYLRLKLPGPGSTTALFNYVGDLFAADDLPDGSLPMAYRTALVEMLGRLDGVTVIPDSPDPRSRLATRVKFVNPDVRPEQTQSLYLDPATGQLLASAFNLPGTQQGGSTVVVERRIVAQPPTDLLVSLGTERVQHVIQQ